MDLRLKDVANLLNVSESTIRRWMDEKKIPHYRLNNHVRFNPSEIEGWILSFHQNKNFIDSREGACNQERLGTHQFGLFRALHKGNVWTNVPGDTKEELIRNSMNLIAPELHLDADVMTHLLIEREQMMSTALSHGVAVPHTRDFLLNDAFDAVAVVFPQKPIDYDALDGKPVHTLFFLFACDDKRHLHLLSKIAHFCSNPLQLETLLKQPSKQELLETIKQWESGLRPPVLSAVAQKS